MANSSSPSNLVRPNVLFIMTDQWRWDWLSCMGTVGPSTPHVDALAARGVHMTHLVTDSAICAPARIALASAMSPLRLDCLTNSSVLPAGTETWHHRFRDSGYRVGLVGQTDLSKPTRNIGLKGNRELVYEWGFSDGLEVEGKMHAAAGGEGYPLGPYGAFLASRGLFEAFHHDYNARNIPMYKAMFSNGHYDDPDWYRDSVLPADAFADTWIGERAVDWLATAGDGPWNLMVSFAGPHDPFDPPTVWADMFRHADMADPVLNANDNKPLYLTTSAWGFDAAHIAEIRRQYSASCAAIDHEVGRMVAVLEDRGLVAETIVVFTSDHGEMLGDHHRFQKHVAYEPSVRVPFVAAGPGIAQGSSEALAQLSDVGPTLCELAGLEPWRGVDGMSFASTLTSPTVPHRDAVVCVEPHYRMVRTQDRKFIWNRNDIEEVYDLGGDPGECENLRGTAPEHELLDLLIEHTGPLPEGPSLL